MDIDLFRSSVWNKLHKREGNFAVDTPAVKFHEEEREYKTKKCQRLLGHAKKKKAGRPWAGEKKSSYPRAAWYLERVLSF